MTYRTRFVKPGEMTGDGVAGGSDLLLSAVHGQKLESCGSGTAASREKTWRDSTPHTHQAFVIPFI
jgi:hypothetical protein